MPKKSRKHENAGNGKPNRAPDQPHVASSPLQPIIEGGWIWAPLKGEWRVLTPEERVRQQFVLRLRHEYGYELEQMDQERKVRHGRQSPKVDIVVWESVVAKQDGRSPAVVVECKSDNVTIDPDDYQQGDSYARATECEFLVTHNTKETRYFRITRGLPGIREDIENIPKKSDLGDARRMEQIRRATKAFTRDEFRQLLAFVEGRS